MNDNPPASGKPQSVVSQTVSILSAAVFVCGVFFFRRLGLGPTGVFLASVLSLTAFQACLELFVRKVHLKPSTGLVFRADHFRRNFSIRRSLVKLAGLYGTLAVLALVYWVVPHYSDRFYGPFWESVRNVGPYFLVLSVPYFVLIDALMSEPRDGYWHFANLLAFRWARVDREILKEHVLGWVIKGFFLPLMTSYLVGAIAGLHGTPVWPFVPMVYSVSRLALCIDLAFVVIGYVFTTRLLDSHIRNANPLLLGWIACLVLYKPFWEVARVYVNYHDGVVWYEWLGDSPLVFVWGTMIILTKLGWAWSNIIFGFRFSNLTHRGIITNGPYRFTKHPSYIFKNLGWWLLYMPFLSQLGPMEAFLRSIALLAVNMLYVIRATTEEMHLSRDPTYVAYARWIDEHGVFRWVGRAIPWLRYRSPKSAEPRETGLSHPNS